MGRRLKWKFTNGGLDAFYWEAFHTPSEMRYFIDVNKHGMFVCGYLSGSGGRPSIGKRDTLKEAQDMCQKHSLGE